MITCPYCNTDNPEKVKFCINCERQIRCKVCEESLFAEKSRCLFCGTLLEIDLAPSQQMNEYEFEEEQTKNTYSKRVRLRYSDNAANIGASLIVGQMSPDNRNLNISAGVFKPTVRVVPKNTDTSQAKLEAISSSAIQQSSTPDIDTSEAILWFGKNDDETDLKVRIYDFKGSSVKEQLKNLILLYIWGHNEIFGYGPTRTQINNFTKAQNLAGNLSRQWKEFISNWHENGGRFTLSPFGERSVREIIEKLQDDNLKGVTYWDGKNKRKSKPAKKTSEEDETAKRWASTVDDSIKIDIRTLKSVSQYAMFAVWLITKKFGIVEAVGAGSVHTFLTEKYKTIPYTRKAIRESLGKISTTKISKTPEGLYYLTPIGESEVQTWITI